MSPVADALAALPAFEVPDDVRGLHPHGRGHINDTFLVECGEARYVLQRLNARVFGDPRAVMENVAAVTRHLRAALLREGAPDLDRRAPALVPTRGGADYHVDARGGHWRLFQHVDGVACDVADTPARAREAAGAFGRFQRLLGGRDAPRLGETIPGFHDTERRLAAFEESARRDAAGRLSGARAEVEEALARRALAGELAGLFRRGALRPRIVHNDAKLDNVIFDAVTGEALCVIDLDTAMPGQPLHDFGDLVRSAASRSAEDERDLTRVRADPAVVAALAEGYLAEAGAILAPAESEALLLAARVIVYEQALRFLADHLDGDRYYRIAWTGHNLDRCRTQLRLLASLEEQQAAIESALRAARGRTARRAQ